MKDILKPNDKVLAYHWGTAGVRVKFCLAVLDDFMTASEKKRICTRIAKWHNKNGANIVDEQGKLI